MKRETRFNRRSLGKVYEQAAAAYLEEKGYRILESNYYNRYGEIDLIALAPEPGKILPDRSGEDLFHLPGVTLVICEVKYRTHRGTGDPAEAVTPVKMRRICRTAVGYYMEQRLSDAFPCRFDVISILGSGEIRHIEDAFPFCC